jgi:hypothetical protein
MTASRGLLTRTPTSVKCPTRIITYGWGKRYIDVLLTLTLPALLAPGNLPYVASEVPCELVILTQRRFFSTFNRHPVIARIKEFCPVRLIKLDDLIVSKDKYGMTLTYALHRAFSDLGPAMTEHWQIFFNADFILADGSLRAVIGHLARGQRIVASPSYCTIAEEVIPELHKHLDEATSTLSISHRELARLILRHRHTVIRGKTVNQAAFHMRYADQFYWSVDDSTLLGYQMPVSIVGLWPERYVPEPHSYWDFGLIWEYCPREDVCVIGDSDEFTMLELRGDSVAQDQIVLGPLNKAEIAQRMVTWVTPYQQHFLKFPLTLHAGDLPSDIDDARAKLRSFVEEVISNTPTLPSHIQHSQWEYHYAQFHHGRQVSSRIQSWIWGKLKLAVMQLIQLASHCRKTIAHHRRMSLVKPKQPMLRVKQRAIKRGKIIVVMGLDGYVRPALRRFGVEILQTKTLQHIWIQLEEATRLKTELGNLKRQGGRFGTVEIEKQCHDEQSRAFQAATSQMRNLEPEFLALYEQCYKYTTASWETLYAIYKSIQYIVTNRVPGDIVQCGVLRGGSMKLAAHVMLSLDETRRTLFLYRAIIKDLPDSYAPAEGIRETVATSGYPLEKLKFLRGDLEHTLPGTIPDRIALLRFDAARYSSTKHEIEQLYPRLSPQGVLMIDSYGIEHSARRAVDEYLLKLDKRPLLQRIDSACHVGIKPSPR